MADLALVFHWAPKDLAAMELDELMGWHQEARERWERDNAES